MRWKTKQQHKIEVKTFCSSHTTSERGTKSSYRNSFDKCLNLKSTSSSIPYEKVSKTPKSQEHLWLHDHLPVWKLLYFTLCYFTSLTLIPCSRLCKNTLCKAARAATSLKYHEVSRLILANAPAFPPILASNYPR